MAKRKTLDQQIADAELKLKKLRSEKSQRERKERTRRLIASAAKIEAVSGITIDEGWAVAIGEAIRDGRVRPADDPDDSGSRPHSEIFPTGGFL